MTGLRVTRKKEQTKTLLIDVSNHNDYHNPKRQKTEYGLLVDVIGILEDIEEFHIGLLQ